MLRLAGPAPDPSGFSAGVLPLAADIARDAFAGGGTRIPRSHLPTLGLAGGALLLYTHSRELRCATGPVMRMGQMAVSLTDRDSCGGEPRHRPLGVRHRVCP